MATAWRRAPPSRAGYDLLDLFDELSEAFDVLDEDDDGRVSDTQASEVLASLGRSLDESRDVAKTYDFDAKTFDFDQFCALVTGPGGLDAKTVAMVSDAAQEVSFRALVGDVVDADELGMVGRVVPVAGKGDGARAGVFGDVRMV